MRPLASAMPGQFRRSPLLLLAGLALFGVGAYELSGMVLTGDTQGLMFLGLAIIVGSSVLSMLSDWKLGTLIFFGWLFAEDLARKYLGNNMAVYFGKDMLVAVVYMSFFIAYRQKKVKIFRPPFFVALAVFFWFGLMQVFNPGSTSFFYGILGMKLYFYYIPLFYIGYAFMQSEEDLRRFFPYLMLIFGIISALGILQSIIGPSFLNPTVLQEDIRELSNTYRQAPISGVRAYRPNAVFVSGGRFAFFLVPAWLFSFGFGGYQLLRSRSRRWLTLVALGCTTVAIVMCASRGTFMWTLASSLICVPALLWGCPWQKGQLVRVLRSFQRTLFVAIFALLLMFLLYPDALQSRLSIYQETLDPSSPASELVHRSQTYPLKQLLGAFDYPRWPYGYGIGTASLGTQYVMRIMHAQYMGIGVESGFGALILEIGIVGLFIYLAFAASILVSAGSVVLKLKGTPWFPIGFIIFWYAFLFLILFQWGGFQQFQDFILNAMFWFMLGVLFRLPSLSALPQEAPAKAPVPAPIRFPRMA